MKKIYTLLAAILMTAAISAQSPDKMSYQAVIRNSSGELVTNQEVGVRVSILQNSIDGTVLYQEIYNPHPKTNNNGLLTIEIGAGVPVTGIFSEIDWLDGPYFIKTDTDPSGGTTYTITGTSQLLSVPYAFHAKTAETISVPIVESDPVFEASPAAGIEAADIGNWDEAYSWGYHAHENYLTEESDPLFTAWDKSTEIEITESQISDLQAYYLASNPDGFISNYTVTEEDVTSHQAALEISESQITDLGNYLTEETQDLAGVLSQGNDADGNPIKNLANPTDAQDAATKAYVDESVPTKYEIGDFAHGGVVFWVDETGQHGLACAKEDQSTGVRWYAGTHGNTRAYGDGPLAGKMNTAIIIAAHVAIGDDGSTYAARLCNELQINEGGKTYGDWYLPSKEELILMKRNRIAIDSTAQVNGGTPFWSAYYWSSTEYYNDGEWDWPSPPTDRDISSWGLDFTPGSRPEPPTPKNYSYMVRAIRAF